MVEVKLILLLCLTIGVMSVVRGEDPYLFFTWKVTYGTISPLGIPQQGILINGQFPGPNINSTTNNNIVINVHNYLDEPFLLTWYSFLSFFLFFFFFIDFFIVVCRQQWHAISIHIICLKNLNNLTFFIVKINFKYIQAINSLFHLKMRRSCFITYVIRKKIIKFNNSIFFFYIIYRVINYFIRFFL